jgi:hypothetical protein
MWTTAQRWGVLAADDLRRPTHMTGVITPERAHEHAPGGISRRRILRTAVWATPVVMVAAAAPAFAASPAVFPFTLTAAAGTGNNANKTVLTFSGGTGSVNVLSVLKGADSFSTLSPNPFTAPGTTTIQQGQNYTQGATYIVTYVFNSVTFVQPVVAA